MEIGKWKTALVPILFKRLKGCVQTETNKRYVRPGELFMVLSDEAQGTWIGIGYKGEISRDATEKELERINK